VANIAHRRPRASRTLVIIVAMSVWACAARANLNLLDAQTAPGTSSQWRFYRGTACSFREQAAICVSGVDNGRRRDVTPVVMAALSTELPTMTNICDGSRPRIRAEYTGDYSRCTHCPAPGLSLRFGMASVRVESGNGWEVDASWSDTAGGSAEQVAQRFGHALAALLREGNSRSCAAPPSRSLQPTSAGMAN
jgi:hypothetical protein